MVVDLLNLQTCLPDAVFHVLGVIHLRVAVGHGGEIEARHGQAESRRLESLTVPQGFHDIYPGLLRHDFLGPLQDADDLFHAETIQELTHPDGVEPALSNGEFRGLVEQVDTCSLDAFGTRFSFHVLLHHLDLLRQVEHRHFHVRVEPYALQRPFSSIAANIVERLHMMLTEDNLEGLGER